MNEADLRTVVEGVRTRLKGADLSAAHECFRWFPCGACSATCDVLATVLEGHFGVVPYLVSAEIGEGEEWRSHAWLEVEGFTVDITADQFGREPAIVAKHSSWHQTLTILRRAPHPMAQRDWGGAAHTVWPLVRELAAPDGG